MKKRVFAFALVLILCCCAAIPVFAAEPCVVDSAQLLTEAEAAALTRRLEDIAQRFSVELAVVTVESCDGEEHADYAKTVFQTYGYGTGENRDGVLLLIDMDPENRGWYIYGKGLGAEAVDNDEIQEIGEVITPYLKDGEYAEAFELFAQECEERIDIEINGAPFNLVRNLAVSIVIGFVIALIVTGSMKSQLKSVRSQPAAENYVRQGSLSVTDSREIFLYRTVERRESPKSSDSDSSSGSSESGGGGSF